MQGNFNINLPSIPGATLKFKIQDVRLKGFLSKQARFKDNKTYLTKRFINSFPNLQSKPESTSAFDEANKSQISTNLSSFFHEDNKNFRLMVADDKKNLLIKFEDQYKFYVPPIYGGNKFDKGYSFPKEGLKDTLDAAIKKYQSQIISQEEQKSIDNYYFNQTQQSDNQSDYEDEIQKRRQARLANKMYVQPSSVFKSQNRWENNQRILRNKIKPGPGSYLLEASPKIRKRKQSSQKETENPQQKASNLNRIRSILKQYKSQLPSQSRKSIELPKEKEKNIKQNTSCFIEGNIDRFGSQIYPVAFKVDPPGPGKYEIHGNLQQKARKILILEQQRKLLKQWYNN